MNAFQYKALWQMTPEESQAENLAAVIEQRIHPEPVADYRFLIAPPCVTDNGESLPCRLIAWERADFLPELQKA